MSNPRILVACTPKSGSTFLSRFLSNYFNAPLVTLVPAHGYRHQEIETALIPATGPFVAQNHILWSEYTERLSQEYGFKIVVLTRNLFDSIVSLREHFLNESPIGPLVSVDETFARQTASDQLDLLVGVTAPWYLNFFASYSRNGYCIHSYDELFSSDWNTRFESLKKLVSDIAGDVDHSETSVENALRKADGEFNRKNVGIVGRGNIISDAHRQWVEKLAIQLDPSFDYRRIGLFHRPINHVETGEFSSLSRIEQYELEYLRARVNKLETKFRELNQIVSEKQNFIDMQREYIDRFQQILDNKIFLDDPSTKLSSCELEF